MSTLDRTHGVWCDQYTTKTRSHKKHVSDPNNNPGASNHQRGVLLDRWIYEGQLETIGLKIGSLGVNRRKLPADRVPIGGTCRHESTLLCGKAMWEEA
jgi:hypothetical protein